MSQFAERFTRIADGFDRRVQAVPVGAWDNPSPYEGWVARPDEVTRMFEGMEPMDSILRSSGQYGPRIDVPDDADRQAKLIAFVGRDPY